MRKMISIILLISMLIVFSNNTFANCEENFEDDVITDEEILEVTNLKGDMQILARSALVYDRTYKKILYEKNINEKIPNASTTKILTAIVAYENSNLKDIVTVSKKAATIGGSSINLRTNSKISMGDLLKGLLISSGNDAAIAIAEHVGGSVENFCAMMNEKAKSLGAYDTNFVTPHGLDNEAHYTTAHDLIIFANYLLDIDYLAQIVNCKEATLHIDNYSRHIHTTNEMLSIYEEASGIKTGYTSKAREMFGDVY